MPAHEEPAEIALPVGLAPVFTPAQAAEVLRSTGLDEITECALRTRAYRKQIPFHLNGNRIIFTIADLREIAEGRAVRPQTPEREDEPAVPEPRPPSARASRRAAPRARDRAPDDAWRARKAAP